MRISLIVEGKTEKVFVPYLRNFLKKRLVRMPQIKPVPQDGRIPTRDKLKRLVELLLNDRKQAADAVIALTDVYTGTKEFVDAADAKSKMRSWVGPNDRFFPHAAQYDFEAWLIPYWDEIQKIAGNNRTVLTANPETVNHDKPPSYHLQEIFRTGRYKKSYVKTRNASKILKGKDLLIAANACSELKAFLNTILTLCGGDAIP